MTIAEKILSSHCKSETRAGDIVIAEIDHMMAQDGTAPLAIRAFHQMGGVSVARPERIIFCIDHNAPSPAMSISQLHANMRSFAKEQGIEITDIGEGVCHQIVVEKGYARPGNLVIGADSHTCTYGALNSFACGVGSTDLASAMLTGKLWFRVPESARVVVKGKTGRGVFAKDIALALVGKVTADGATYLALEITGETIEALEIDGRLTISNMVVEMGAKAGIMLADKKIISYLEGRAKGEWKPVEPDPRASYVDEIELDVSKLSPQVAMPHSPDNVFPIEEVEGKTISQGLIGTCTNGRLEDLRVAASLLSGRKLKEGVRLIIAPASRNIMLHALKEGLVEIFLEAGCVVVNPGCASCVGTHQGIPGDGENVISTANRNFKGRMGNPNSFIYLASPATVAASCIEGRITDPRKYI